MRVRAIKNRIDDLPEDLQNFSFNQDQYGDIDITIDRIYDVYGIRRNTYGTFYLVTTDEINENLPWWMPSALYDIENSEAPAEWVQKKEASSYGGDMLTSSWNIYFDVEEDIEDRTDRGQEVFEQMQRLNTSK